MIGQIGVVRGIGVHHAVNGHIQGIPYDHGIAIIVEGKAPAAKHHHETLYDAGKGGELPEEDRIGGKHKKLSGMNDARYPSDHRLPGGTSTDRTPTILSHPRHDRLR